MAPHWTELREGGIIPIPPTEEQVARFEANAGVPYHLQARHGALWLCVHEEDYDFNGGYKAIAKVSATRPVVDTVAFAYHTVQSHSEVTLEGRTSQPEPNDVVVKIEHMIPGRM